MGEGPPGVRQNDKAELEKTGNTFDDGKAIKKIGGGGEFEDESGSPVKWSWWFLLLLLLVLIILWFLWGIIRTRSDR
jgi:hypothetical protein